MENKSKCCPICLTDHYDGVRCFVCQPQKNTGLKLEEVYAQRDDVLEFQEETDDGFYYSHQDLSAKWNNEAWLNNRYTITKRKSDEAKEEQEGYVQRFTWEQANKHIDKIEADNRKLKAENEGLTTEMIYWKGQYNQKSYEMGKLRQQLAAIRQILDRGE